MDLNLRPGRPSLKVEFGCRIRRMRIRGSTVGGVVGMYSRLRDENYYVCKNLWAVEQEKRENNSFLVCMLICICAILAGCVLFLLNKLCVM